MEKRDEPPEEINLLTARALRVNGISPRNLKLKATDSAKVLYLSGSEFNHFGLQSAAAAKPFVQRCPGIIIGSDF
jgi:hypothetical protein